MARALVAELTRLQQQDTRGLPFDGCVRDALVDLCVQVTGGGDRGVFRSVLDRFVGVAHNFAAKRYLDRRRGSLTDAATPLTGDIIFYQTRGGRIRAEICAAIEAAARPVAVLAHSLGGIASVDLLVRRSCRLTVSSPSAHTRVSPLTATAVSRFICQHSRYLPA